MCMWLQTMDYDCVPHCQSCYVLIAAEFSKMKDELPESFKKGLEAVEREESLHKTTPTTAKETTPSDKTAQGTTPTLEKEKVSNNTVTLLSANQMC